MLAQIVCRSCGYHRTWPTLLEALADGHRHHANHSALRETRERRCPVCHSEAIAPVGHVVAEKGLIWVEHRCEMCGIWFWFVRKPLI